MRPSKRGVTPEIQNSNLDETLHSNVSWREQKIWRISVLFGAVNMRATSWSKSAKACVRCATEERADTNASSLSCNASGIAKIRSSIVDVVVVIKEAGAR